MNSYDAFHTVVAGPGVKGIIGMHRFNMCLVVLSLSCSGVKTPLGTDGKGIQANYNYYLIIVVIVCQDGQDDPVPDHAHV